MSPLILDSPRSSTSSVSTSQTLVDQQELRRREHHEADIVIVGAGIVGSSAAVAFANQGRSVILLERSMKEPDRIVGELLQPGGVNALTKLGLDGCLENIDAIPVRGYEIIYHGEPVHIPYPLEDDPKTGRRGQAQGRSFHHGRFIQQLRNAALRNPNVTVIETTATDLVKDEWTGQILGVETKTKGSKDYYFGHLTLACDGYASTFRKSYLPHTPKTRSKFYGLELIDCPLPLPNHGHVLLSNNAPVLLYQIGAHETRALIDVPEKCPAASVAKGGVKGYLQNTILPSLPEQVKPSFEEAIGRGLRSMPNSFLPPSTNKTPGLIIVGDAMNMRHPLTGGGMTVGLNDVCILQDLLSPQNIPVLSDTKSVLAQMKTFHWKRKSGSSVINILAMALYALFAADDPTLTLLQRGCYHYFLLGGTRISGPVGLLAGLTPNPLVLVYHFFSVAMYAIWIALYDGLKSGPTGAIKTAIWFMVGGPMYVLLRAGVVIGEFVVAELRS